MTNPSKNISLFSVCGVLRVIRTIIINLFLDDLHPQDDAELRERLQVVDVDDLRTQRFVQAVAERLQILSEIKCIDWDSDSGNQRSGVYGLALGKITSI